MTFSFFCTPFVILTRLLCSNDIGGSIQRSKGGQPGYSLYPGCIRGGCHTQFGDLEKDDQLGAPPDTQVAGFEWSCHFPREIRDGRRDKIMDVQPAVLYH